MTRIQITGINLEAVGDKVKIGTTYYPKDDGQFVMWEEAKGEIDTMLEQIAILRARIAKLEEPK